MAEAANPRRSFRDVVNAIEFMEAHLRDSMGVPDVARESGLSSWHFQRIFSELVGETIGSYLRRRRLALALEELRSSTRKVIDIALDLQFGSPEAFTRAFKAEFGLSPVDFRRTNVQIVPFRKPKMDENRLRYVVEQLRLEPQIRTIEPIHVVGLRTSFVSPLAKPRAYLETVTKVWQEFVRRESEIPHKLGAIKVGVSEGIASPLHHIHDDMMEYLACTPVTQAGALPAGLEAFTIPAGTYAVFEGTGFHEQTQLTIDYVYATWLPNNRRYQRSEGPGFTWLDHRAEPLDPKTSKVQFFLPVRDEG